MVEFIFFGLTLLGVAIFHRQTLKVSLVGLASILIYKLIFDVHFSFLAHLAHEWNILLNLFGLLLGFAILARHFEQSHVPDKIPDYLPAGWLGAYSLLACIFILAIFLDNIAAAIIGGTIAFVVFKTKVHLGYLAAIVAASNAGGSGSVIGDTTTTMMWISGVPALNVLSAYIGAVTSFLFFAPIAAYQQNKLQPIQKTDQANIVVDKGRILIVGLILVLTIVTNILADFPALGVWLAILIGATFRKTDWHELKVALPGSIFLLALVMSASLMPVGLPSPSWQSTLGLGFVSAVFDNIPLTKLALQQGGYDWGFLAYAVGFGGSITWFGSSAGVALSNQFPETKSVVNWVKNGWHVAVAYLIGFGVMLLIHGWQP